MFKPYLSPYLKLCLIVPIAFLITSCGQGESNVESGNRLGTAHIGNGAEPQGMDPHVVTGVPESNIINAIFEGLVYKDASTLEVQPGVAESWEISDDGRIYTFNIRRDAKWSNGDSLTAQDFVWSWWRGLQPALGSQYVFMFFPIKNAEAFFRGEVTDFDKVGVKAIDDYTLQVELNNPTPYFLQLMDHYSTFPVHRATIEKFGEAWESYTGWTRPQNIVSNGPFKMDSWQLNRNVKVSPNPHYWDHDRIKLNGIVFYSTELSTTEERMFRAGQLHYTNESLIDRIPYYRENYPERLQIAPYVGTYLYRLNTEVEGLDDPRVRRALAMTIDRDRLVTNVLNDIFTPAYSITPPGLLGYQPPKLFDYDPEGARTLLAEAGYPNGEGFPSFELQYNTSEQHRKVAIAVQQMWNKELNIQVNLQNKDWKVYLDDENTGNFQISRGGWIADYVDPNSFLDLWITGSELNRTNWGNSEYDELVLRTAPEAKTREERFAAFYEAESIILKDMPFIPIYTYSSHHFRHPSLIGLPPNLMNFYNFRDVWLDPDWEQKLNAKRAAAVSSSSGGAQ
ncbi:MAG: peptide ABC transporter substrate-binding protein [Arenicella sp.]|jgi:oligopeptide transport system substrate-binding protein|nr:peptide ABC transporter substrate-binding protein [Arenicella sp.]